MTHPPSSHAASSAPPGTAGGTQPPPAPVLDLSVHSHIMSPGLPTQAGGKAPDASLVVVVGCRTRLDAVRRDRMLRDLVHSWAGELAFIAQALSASARAAEEGQAFDLGAHFAPGSLVPGAPGAAATSSASEHPGTAPASAAEVNVHTMIEIHEPEPESGGGGGGEPRLTLHLRMEDAGRGPFAMRIAAMAALAERVRPLVGPGVEWTPLEICDRRPGRRT